jgi:hypothetical protein
MGNRQLFRRISYQVPVDLPLPTLRLNAKRGIVIRFDAAGSVAHPRISVNPGAR